MICDNCDHLESNHLGPVDMGGGNVEPMGCLENDENGNLCQCLKWEFES